MIVTSTRNDIELMRKETIWLYNEKLYIIVFILFILITIDVLISIKNKKFRKQCIILLLVLAIFIILIVKNIRSVNKSYEIYSGLKNTECELKIIDNALIIDSITINRHTVIKKDNIKKIVYKKYNIFIYTNDNKIYCIPNSIYLVDYLKNKLHLQ